jgi:hypothetical protein
MQAVMQYMWWRCRRALGAGVYECAYCHGWEVCDRPLAVYGSEGVG